MVIVEMFSLDKLLDDFNNGREPIIKYYVIGMWLITNDYNKDGYIIDFMVCKGQNWLEAVEEARKFKNSIMNIKFEKYLPLTIGKTVLEATKNTDYFGQLLWKEEVMPDDERIQNSFDLVVEEDNKDDKN